MYGLQRDRCAASMLLVDGCPLAGILMYAHPVGLFVFERAGFCLGLSLLICSALLTLSLRC